MPTKIKNQPPSRVIRERLAAEGKPVLVAFSMGKDSIAAELALRDSGVDTRLVYLYYVPRGADGVSMRFIDDGLARLEDQLGKEIRRYPHPSLYRFLNNFVFQPPERCAVIEAAMLPTPSYDDMWALIRGDMGLDAETWVADGVRAADSIVRRAALSRYGVMKSSNRKVSPIADWLKAEVLACIEGAGVDLPVDYEWFGRSFDGIDYRFTKPLSEHAPDDFKRLLEWFPLADLEIFRHGISV